MVRGFKRAQADQERVARARKVADELGFLLRQILKDGNLLALPVLPGPPPGRAAPPAQAADFERRALQLASIATLAGLPQVLAIIRHCHQPLALPPSNSSRKTLSPRQEAHCPQSRRLVELRGTSRPIFTCDHCWQQHGWVF